jgi:hypothetical protein
MSFETPLQDSTHYDSTRQVPSTPQPTIIPILLDWPYRPEEAGT